MRKTKIIATLGPVSGNVDTISSLIKAGVNLFRLNLSHSNHKYHADIISTIRNASASLGIDVSIIADLQGPKIRLGDFEGGSVTLFAGDRFVLTTDDIKGNRQIASVSYKNLPRDVKPDGVILINDGLVKLKVTDINDKEVGTVVVIGGLISNRKGINLPGAKISTPSLTDKDLSDIEFILKQDIDFIAMSFVRTAEDVRGLKKLIHGSSRRISIIAKIEKPEALSEIEEIATECDAIMIARGDLGVEVDPERVPWIQKEIIKTCNRLGKPVIVATQMLESMIEHPQPTRAEVTDVANAILDGADTVMLSGETAMGQYPIEAVSIMDRIAGETESHYKQHSLEFFKKHTNRLYRIGDSLTHAALACAEDINARIIITVTESGLTARFMAKYRPHSIILAVSPNQETLRSLQIVWGVYPLRIERLNDTDSILNTALSAAKENGFIKEGDLVVVTAGLPLGKAGTTNMLKVIEIRDNAVSEEGKVHIKREKGQTLMLDRSLCTACGLCVEECDMDILSIEEGRLCLDKERLVNCIGDGRCVLICPKEALYFV